MAQEKVFIVEGGLDKEEPGAELLVINTLQAQSLSWFRRKGGVIRPDTVSAGKFQGCWDQEELQVMKHHLVGLLGGLSVRLQVMEPHLVWFPLLASMPHGVLWVWHGWGQEERQAPSSDQDEWLEPGSQWEEMSCKDSFGCLDWGKGAVGEIDARGLCVCQVCGGSTNDGQAVSLHCDWGKVGVASEPGISDAGDGIIRFSREVEFGSTVSADKLNDVT
jgi:hypothetical protein